MQESLHLAGVVEPLTLFYYQIHYKHYLAVKQFSEQQYKK